MTARIRPLAPLDGDQNAGYVDADSDEDRYADWAQ